MGRSAFWYVAGKNGELPFGGAIRPEIFKGTPTESAARAAREDDRM
jgi:hypothetical protein